MTISEKLNHIEKLKSELDKLRPQENWDDAFLKKIKIDFTYSSNKLEGNTLTYGQTVKLLKDFVTPKNAAAGDLLDMINHQKILDTVFTNYRSQNISEDNIKSLHAELMKDIVQWGDDGLYSLGQYKSFENMTIRSTGKIHAYLLPEKVPEAMTVLILQTNQLLQNVDINDAGMHPLSIVTFFHQQFLNVIHPFSDGNGRIARIFMNLILLKSGYPPIFIKEINKDEYLKRFEISDNDMNPMLDLMCDKLIESLQEKLEFMKT